MTFRFPFVAAAFALLAALLPYAGDASAQQPIVIKFSHVVAARHAQRQGRRVLQEACRGAHQGPRQGRGLSEQPALQGRRGDGGAAARLGADAGAVGRQVRSAGRARVRGVRPAVHLRQLRRAAQGHRRRRSGKKLFKKLETKGIIGLAYWDNGFKDFSANKALKAARRRQGTEDAHPVVERPRGARSGRSAALPQKMAFSEVYQALQTGVVDGTENPPSNFYTQKMHEVQKYLTLTDHGVIELRGDRQQEVLGRAAGGHPHGARRRDEGRDQVRQRHRQKGERRCARSA